MLQAAGSKPGPLRTGTSADIVCVPMLDPAALCSPPLPSSCPGHIVQQLLQRGYTVHATCRDPSNPKAVAHLTQLQGADERLKLFAADLTLPGSFMQAMAGCKYVIHTASPYALECPPGQVGRVRGSAGAAQGGPATAAARTTEGQCVSFFCAACRRRRC